MPISQVRGSEGRSRYFDRDFNPLYDQARGRWLNIARLRQQGKELPPVVLVQVVIMTVFAVYVLGMMLAGSLLWLLVITLMLALAAMTLGLFLSAYAQSEFQLLQFVPIIIVPQVFFSGLFQLETMPGWLRAIGHVLT